ncbi:hypothetical protein ACVWYH_003868 [Bradyrhizobium sp. GM24.11]
MRSRNICGEDDLRQVHLPDQVGRNDVGIFELLVEVPCDQLHGVFQLALAVDQCALAKLAGRHGGHCEDAGDKQCA